MNSRRVVVGLSLLCALLFSAFAASSASAKGTTAFTCEHVETGAQFSDEHCKTGTKEGEGWKHKEIIPGSATEFEATNAKTAQTTSAAAEIALTATVGGVNMEMSCHEKTATGTLTNEAGPPMKVKYSNVSINYIGCTTEGVLGELECKVKTGEIKAKGLTGETKENNMTVEFKPEVGKPFFTFELEKCSEAGLNAAYEITGTYLAIPEGATIRTSNLTTKGLKFAGQQASLFTKSTLRMKGEGNPISFTTTAT